MSGSPRRRRVRREEDISGQFRVTVPDAEDLDQLRTRGGVYRRGLYPIGNRSNAPPRELSPCLHLHVNPPQNLWIQMTLGGLLQKYISKN